MPTLTFEIYPLTIGHPIWGLFAPHHYLTDKIMTGPKRSTAFIMVWNDDLVGFTSSIFMPSGTLKNAWREHRTVVLPDYQGMGLGLRLSEWLGEYHLRRGERFYSRTTHPRMGAARDTSPLWRATGKNRKMRKSHWSNATDSVRLAYSHEYIGNVIPSDRPSKSYESTSGFAIPC